MLSTKSFIYVCVRVRVCTCFLFLLSWWWCMHLSTKKTYDVKYSDRHLESHGFSEDTDLIIQDDLWLFLCQPHQYSWVVVGLPRRSSWLHFYRNCFVIIFQLSHTFISMWSLLFCYFWFTFECPSVCLVLK